MTPPETRGGPPGRHTPGDRRQPASSPPSAKDMPFRSLRPGDDRSPDLAARAAELDAALALWATRDSTGPQPGVRQAANDALDEIDGMIAELHQLRARLTGEMRDADDETAARVDALLAQRKRS